MKFDPFTRPRWFQAYSFALVTGSLFLLSWGLQLVFQLAEVRVDAVSHGQSFTWARFWPRFFAATFENWQSEFLQLMTQAVGLTLLYHWGSAHSRERLDRVDAKLDEVLRRLPDRRIACDVTGELRRRDHGGQ